MALKKIRLGDVIDFYKEKCGVEKLSPYDVSGINKEKEFFEPSNQVGQDTTNYQIVPKGYFACNLMHVGRDIVLPVALNIGDKTKNVSPAYTVFKLKDNSRILPRYLYMYFNSVEKDRSLWFHTDASVRDGMSNEDFCDIEIDLPDLATQQKYVDIYNAMKANQKAYERGLEDLKLVCDGYIEKLRKEVEPREIGEYIENVRDKNSNDAVADVFGVSILKKFITASSSVDKSNLSAYKIVKFQDIAYVPTTHMKVYAIAISNNKEDFVVSPIYEVFRVKNKNILIPEYLFLWLCRDETKRYAFYNSWGSARENFNFDDMCTVKIPIPPIQVQESIANIYKSYEQRKEINEQLKEKIRDICPILIKGSIDEARGN